MEKLINVQSNKKFWAMNSAVFILVLAIVLGTIWWHARVYSDPQQVFWGMVDNSLTTAGVTKETLQNSGTTRIDEFTQLVFAPSARVHDIRQVTATIGSAPLHLTLESVATPTDDYQRYSYVQRTSRSDQPQSVYDNLYKQWLHNGGAAQGANPRIFNQAAFGAILFGNVNQPDRAKVVNLLRQTYSADYASAKRQSLSGRDTYTFNISISLKNYAAAARLYAKQLGLPNANDINPADYQPSDSSRVSVTVDILSRQLVKAVYQSSGMTENYSGYGIASAVNLPSRSASPAEFENALNQISP